MPTSEMSATEAAELLGLTRERLRQLAAAGALPDRVATSSRFRPRYLRESIAAYGHATGRIVDSEPPPAMALVVDELVERALVEAGWEPREPQVAHVRVWRRSGWLPLVLLGAPIHTESALRSTTHRWEAEVRRRFLPDAPFIALWLYVPEGGPDRGADPAAFPLYLERDQPTSWREHEPERLGAWLERSHEDLERIVGASVTAFPGALYTRDLIERVRDADDEPVEVGWDPHDLAGLTAAALVLADRAASEPAEDGRAMNQAAWFIAAMARMVDEYARETMPSPSPALAIRPIDLDAVIWARIDALAAEFRAESPPTTSNRDTRREHLRLRRELERLLAERGDAMPWRLREAVDRARRFIPPTGDPDR